MSSYTGISPKDPNKYVGPSVYISSIVSRNRQPTGADYRQPETGKIYPLGSYWIISRNPINGAEGDLWYLSKVVANIAYWIQLSAGSTGTIVDIEVDAVTAPGVNPVTPISGEIDFHGAVVANHSVPVETRSRALNTMNLEVQYATTAALSDGTKSGLSHFDSSAFSVDASGFVTLLGGTEGINAMMVDSNTPPGTNPVLPSGGNIITVTGGQIAPGSTGNVIRTNSLSSNTYTIEIQRASAETVTTVTSNGVSHFNSSQFSVDSDGFVSLIGGGIGADSFAMQAGTSPIFPDGAGLVTFNGSVVAAGTNPVRTNGTGATTMTLEVQRSQAVASTDATRVGLSNFNSSQFTVDPNGFVSLTGGGLAIDSVGVDASTGPGTNPVLPSGAGLITVTGGQVAAGTIGSNAIRTNSLSANNYTVQIQRAAGAATSSVNNNGIASFNSSDFSVDSNGYVSLNPITSSDFTNLGISFSGTTFTVTGYNGTALSASNPAVIWLQNRTVPGRVIKYVVTANQTFTSGSAGTTAGMRWGLTAGVNASVDIPFYLYAVGNDAQNAISFMISRVPHASNSPASTSIGQSGAVVNVGQGDFFSLATITTTSYDQNPCIILGSFRMQFVGATNSWTVQTLTTTDGLDLFQEDKNFTMPRGQFGAAAGKWFLDNGGTAPDDSVGSYYYKVERSGLVTVDFSAGSITTAGAGSNQVLLSCPFVRTSGISAGSGYWVGAGGSPGSIMTINLIENTNTFTTVINTYSSGLGMLVTSNILNSQMGISAVYRMAAVFPAQL